MTSVDNVFRDTSGRAYNEFMPVSLVLRPYVQELKAAADAHVKQESPDGVTISNGIGKPGTLGRCDTTSLEEGRASSGQSATEPLGQQASAFCQGSVKKEKAAKLPRWKTRTAEQYIAHRHNQHKYREREKQRLQELSSTLHDLSYKMQERAVQDAENDFLENECEHLQKLLEEKDQELAAIQSQSSSSSSQSASPEASSAASALGSDTNMADVQSSSVPLDPELGLKDHKAMHEAYQFVVNEFKQFLGTLHLWPVPVTGHVPDVDAEANQRIHGLLKHLMTVCMEMSRLSNAMRQDVRCYLHATAAELDKLELCSQSGTFDSVVHQLQLSQPQRAEMLKVRKQWRDFLASLYDERQQLNNKILGHLTDNTAGMEPADTLWQKQHYITPHSRANIVYADQQLQPPSERIGSTKTVSLKPEPATSEQTSSSETVQQTLPALLEKLEANLAKELCHISEQDHLTMTQLLKPVQAAWFVILVFPDHCDCLALLNAVQRQHDHDS